MSAMTRQLLAGYVDGKGTRQSQCGPFPGSSIRVLALWRLDDCIYNHCHLLGAFFLDISQLPLQS